MAAGSALLVLMACVAVLAPLLLTVDPIEMKPAQRLRPPGAAHWFGTDMYGRDSYSRVIYGARISLVVGLVVATVTSAIGLGLGVFAGFVRRLDGIVMRVMDGIMALPDLLLAITFVALTGASVRNVVIALVIPQTPRVVRLVRSVVLSLREQPFVEASVALGAGVGRTVLRHVLPNTLAPLIVQGTYVCASAVLIEAALSFLGAGTPPEIPSWGNIMAEARAHVRVAFWLLLFPGLFLASTVLDQDRGRPGHHAEAASLDLYAPEPAPGGSQARRAARLDPVPVQPQGSDDHQGRQVGTQAGQGRRRRPDRQSSRAPDGRKLTLEMFFDATSTQDGAVVKAVETAAVAAASPPRRARGQKKPSPPLVVLHWGNITSFASVRDRA